jgi:hypothetical protein
MSASRQLLNELVPAAELQPGICAHRFAFGDSGKMLANGRGEWIIDAPSDDGGTQRPRTPQRGEVATGKQPANILDVRSNDGGDSTFPTRTWGAYYGG